MSRGKYVLVWFRRDLRLEDHVALAAAQRSNDAVLPLFIFDDQILDELPAEDARVNFIYDELSKINDNLRKVNGKLLIKKGNPLDVWASLIEEYDIAAVYWNHDYEPYAENRDQKVRNLLEKHSIKARSFKDQVVFEKDEVTKDDGLPYTVFTPYMKKWKATLREEDLKDHTLQNFQNWAKVNVDFPSKAQLGIKQSHIKVKPFDIQDLADYNENRNIPSLSNSNLSPHLRFGTLSVRQLVKDVKERSDQFLNELIWREFFMQILHHFPHTVQENFKAKYNGITWRNNEEEFERWCQGMTGYPLVDAGMRELNATGYMHGRVRMVVASFLCKHLLIDWRWGEAYFASKLLDFELSSNVGNWQWVAGTGCDAAPYFRIFNPTEQLKKFDPEMKYVKKWVKDLDELSYPQPIVDHSFARKRCLDTYKEGIEESV